MKQLPSARPKKSQAPTCSHPTPVGHAADSGAEVARAAKLFRAMGDVARLRLLQLLAGGDRCVGEIVAGTGEKFPTVSQRLRILHAEGLVARRRKGLHVIYSLADRHVEKLLANALAHAHELNAR